MQREMAIKARKKKEHSRKAKKGKKRAKEILSLTNATIVHFVSHKKEKTGFYDAKRRTTRESNFTEKLRIHPQTKKYFSESFFLGKRKKKEKYNHTGIFSQ